MQGRRVTLAAVVGTLASGAFASAAMAGPPPTAINVADDVFDSDNETQILESSTFWNWDDSVTNEHNVRQDDKLFYSGQPTDDPGASYNAGIASGKYHYYCTAHGSSRGGMDGVIKVTPISAPIDDDSFQVLWGQDNVKVPAQYDVQYHTGNGKWKDWIKNTTRTSRTFGANDKPVDVKPAKTYSFRARTEARADPTRASGFSPVLEVPPAP